MHPKSRKKPKRPTNSSVLILGPDADANKKYVEWIRTVEPCEVDQSDHIKRSLQNLSGIHYNLVVADLSETADDSEGIDFLQRVKRENPSSSVILITQNPSISQAVNAIRLGAEDFFKKPVNPEAFKLAVKRSLDRKAVFEENDGATGFLHLLNTCQMISASLEVDRIFDTIRSYFSKELGSIHAAFFFVLDGAPVRYQEAKMDTQKDRAMEEVLDIAIYSSNPFSEMIQKQEMYRILDRTQTRPGLFVFRFRCAGEEDYFFVCLSPSQPKSIDLFDNQVRLLAKQIEVTGNHIKQFQGVRKLVYLDEATGLFNTRYLNDLLEKEIFLSDREKRSFAVLFIDVDFFKTVNDAHGHLVGTQILHELGRHFKEQVRDDDTVFRYGGDEFIAVLSPCDLKTAKAVAERIRTSTEQRLFQKDEGKSIKLTVSIGIALYPDHAKTRRTILEMADQAMYVAKKSSRNCIYVVPSEKEVKSGTIKS